MVRDEIEIPTNSTLLFCADGVVTEGTGSRKIVPFNHQFTVLRRRSNRLQGLEEFVKKEKPGLLRALANVSLALNLT